MAMEYESNNWIWEWMYNTPHLFGGLMLTAALLGFSTSYFGGIGNFPVSYAWSNLGFLLKKKREKRRVRVYMDGCFDLMHYGHANALRQAKALGDELVVGVVSDEEIIANKGPPILSMEERLALVSGLKWVDQVIANAPYAITEEFMNSLFNEHKIDYIIHGDDPCLLPDGSDAYALAKIAGRYKQIKRTEGVSSTDIVGRILSSVNDNKGVGDNNSTLSKVDSSKRRQLQRGQLSQFLPTSRRIVQFSNGKSFTKGYKRYCHRKYLSQVVPDLLFTRSLTGSSNPSCIHWHANFSCKRVKSYVLIYMSLIQFFLRDLDQMLALSTLMGHSISFMLGMWSLLRS
ncbi:hypothetical protein Gotur_022588 [Gossypium turneri]